MGLVKICRMDNKALLIVALLLYVSNPGMRYYCGRFSCFIVSQTFNMLKDLVIVLVDVVIPLHREAI